MRKTAFILNMYFCMMVVFVPMLYCMCNYNVNNKNSDSSLFRLIFCNGLYNTSLVVKAFDMPGIRG